MKRLLFFISILCFVPSVTWTQNNSTNQVVLFNEAEVKPQFPDGDLGIRRFLRQNMRYPEKAKDARVQGMVLVQFVVTTQGTLQDITVSKSVHELLDAEAIRLVQSMPVWKPGEQNGKPVNVQYTLPVRFELK